MGKKTDAYRCEVWYEWLRLNDAAALATSRDVLGNETIIASERTCDQGKAIYLGTQPDEAARRALFSDLLNRSGIAPEYSAEERDTSDCGVF